MTRYHFISGLPRSGSTLLSALLRQNPAFYANISSPLGTLFHSTRNAMGTWNETSVMLSDAHRQRILKGLFDSYYGDQDDKRVIFDTNRAWCARLPALMRLFPEAKVICCVRSVAWIMAKVSPVVRETVLPPDLFDRLDALSFWRDLSNSRARMIVAKRTLLQAAAE